MSQIIKPGDQLIVTDNSLVIDHFRKHGFDMDLSHFPKKDSGRCAFCEGDTFIFKNIVFHASKICEPCASKYTLKQAREIVQEHWRKIAQAKKAKEERRKR